MLSPGPLFAVVFVALLAYFINRSVGRYLCLLGAILIFSAGIVGYVQHEGWFGLDRKLGLQINKGWTHCNKSQLEEISRHLRNFNKEHGRYPSNDEGLTGVVSLVKSCRTTDIWDPSEAEQADWPEDLAPPRLDKSGVLSKWGEPFIYENRKGLEGKFAGSGATADYKRAYSVQVDDDIFVWSIGGWKDYESYQVDKAHYLFLVIGLFCSAIILLGLYILATLRQARYNSSLIKTFLLNSILAIPIILLVTLSYPIRSCYAWATSVPRTPKLTKDYIQLIEKYHKRGIISEKAYKKMVKTVREPSDCPY